MRRFSVYGIGHKGLNFFCKVSFLRDKYSLNFDHNGLKIVQNAGFLQIE